jgi:hypothetical protein
VSGDETFSRLEEVGPHAYGRDYDEWTSRLS